VSRARRLFRLPSLPFPVWSSIAAAVRTDVAWAARKSWTLGQPRKKGLYRYTMCNRLQEPFASPVGMCTFAVKYCVPFQLAGATATPAGGPRCSISVSSLLTTDHLRIVGVRWWNRSMRLRADGAFRWFCFGFKTSVGPLERCRSLCLFVKSFLRCLCTVEVHGR